MPDLRDYVSAVKEADDLTVIKRRISARYEVAALTAKSDGSHAVLFEDVEGSDFRMVSNLIGTRSRFAMAVGASPAGIHERLASCIEVASRPRPTAHGRFMENARRDATALPVVTHFEKEPGPFITSSIVYATNPETGKQNSSFHRMMPIDGTHFSIRVVEGRHLDRCFADAVQHGDDLKVAVTIGVHPAVSIAGAYQAEWGSDELDVANAILGGELTVAECPYSSALVPADAEIVLEGRLLQDVTHQEWMVEMLQTYDYKREQPVFELESLYYRDEPIFHDILAGFAEHRLLMGMPVESKLNHKLKSAFPQVSGVVMTDGGCSWLHAVVQMKKGSDSEPGSVIQEAFRTHRSLKQITVVDADIDPNSAESVEYAMATRFQADRDLTVIEDVRGSSLDPSSDQENLRTAKMGIDATIPLSKQREGFEVARIPGADKISLDDYL